MPGTGADSWLREPADHGVDVPITCVISRFGLRGARHLLPTRQDYRTVVAEARSSETPGLLRSAFLIEDPRTCYSLSIWAEPGAIPRFGADVPAHVEAARRVFGRLAFDPDRGPELWSAKWRLVSVSNNLNWSDFDLRQAIVAAVARKE